MGVLRRLAPDEQRGTTMKLLQTVLPVAVSVVALLSTNAVAQTTLRVVMHSDL